jgi:hypothetical protein
MINIPAWALYRLARAFRLPIRPAAHARTLQVLSASPYRSVRLAITLSSLLPTPLLWTLRHRPPIVSLYAVYAAALAEELSQRDES